MSRQGADTGHVNFLRPAPHLWQVGLAPAAGRCCDTLVIPVATSLRPLLEPLKERWPHLAWVPEDDYGHMTLAAREAAVDFSTSKPVPVTEWGVVSFDVTDYSLRAVLDADLAPAAEAFGLPPRDAYLTLAYALEATELGDLPRAPELSGESRRVEHRRLDAQCAPFTPRLVGTW